MTTEIDPRLSATLGQKIRPTHGYYRQPDGWITFSVITRLEKLKYTESGWEALDQYGSFDPSPYVVNHELEGLFMMGGAHELTLDQIVKTGLYIDPPMVPTCRNHMTQYHRSHDADCWVGAKPVEFPQLEGKDLKPFPCEFCERVLPTTEAKEQHQSVFHKEEKGNIQQGQSLGASLATALGNTNLLPAQVSEEALLKRIEELQAELARKEPTEITCGCGGMFKDGGQGRAFHERGRAHQEWAKSTLVVGSPDPT